MISASLVKELREKTGAGMLDCKKALEECNANIEEATTWLREKGISSAEKKASRIAADGLASILIKDNNAVIVEVNSETDFVAKNQEFVDLVNDIMTAIMNNNPKSDEDVLYLEIDGIKIEDLIVEKTSKMGEKLSFRRFTKLSKSDNQVFGSYIHMGGKIAVVIVLDGASEEVANNVAMQAAAMRPLVVRRDDLSQEEIDKERAILKEQAINEGKPEDIASKMVEGRIAKYYKEVCLEEQEYVKDGDITVGKYVGNNDSSINKMIRYEVGEGMEKREENFAEEVAKQMNG